MNVNQIQILQIFLITQAAATQLSYQNDAVSSSIVPVSNTQFYDQLALGSESRPFLNSHLLYPVPDSAEHLYSHNFGSASQSTKNVRSAAPEHSSHHGTLDRHKYSTFAPLFTASTGRTYLPDHISPSSTVNQRPSVLSSAYVGEPEPSNEEGSSSPPRSPSHSTSHRDFDSSDYIYPPYPPLPPLREPENPPRTEYQARTPDPHRNPEPYSKFEDRQSEYNAEDRDEDSRPQYQSKNQRKTETVRQRPYLPHHPSRNQIDRMDESDVPQARSRQQEGDDERDDEEIPGTFLKDVSPEEGGEELYGERDREKNMETPSSHSREKFREQQQHQRHHDSGETRSHCVRKRRDLNSDEAAINDVAAADAEREMSCLECKNLDTGDTYETCSYESAPSMVKYYALLAQGEEEEASELKRTRHGPSTRMKRYANDDDFDDAESEHFEDEDDFAGGGGDDDDYTSKPSMPAYANEDSCVQVKKNGATCTVCLNPETNGKYKQCSYANQPDEDSYEYARSARYGSGTKNRPSSRHVRSKRQQMPASEPTRFNPTPVPNSTARNLNKRDHTPPTHEKQRALERNNQVRMTNRILETTAVRSKRDKPNFRYFSDGQDSSYENHFLDMFPELDAEEDLLAERRSSLLSDLDNKSLLGKSGGGGSSGFGLLKHSKLGGYFDNRKSLLDGSDEGGGGMTKMMQDFASKDRSACTKRMKDKMTCYVCNDSDGIKREECMYVVENEPKKVTYKESTQTSDPEGKHLKREVLLPDDVSTSPARPHLQFYTMSSRSPQTYSNVEIMYTRQHVPTTSHIFKRYAQFSNTIADRSSDVSLDYDDPPQSRSAAASKRR